jgi:hypothetical protein
MAEAGDEKSPMLRRRGSAEEIVGGDLDVGVRRLREVEPCLQDFLVVQPRLPKAVEYAHLKFRRLALRHLGEEERDAVLRFELGERPKEK